MQIVLYPVRFSPNLKCWSSFHKNFNIKFHKTHRISHAHREPEKYGKTDRHSADIQTRVKIVVEKLCIFFFLEREDFFINKYTWMCTYNYVLNTMCCISWDCFIWIRVPHELKQREQESYNEQCAYVLFQSTGCCTSRTNGNFLNIKNVTHLVPHDFFLIRFLACVFDYN
jgi:hypothetical protein